MSEQSKQPRVIYLHGFASSPRSNKARAFRAALEARGICVAIPDLNLNQDGQSDFEGLTISRQLAVVEKLTVDSPPDSVVLIGSSLGGYTAALFAARSDKVAGLVLMAPAFDFARLWRQRLGPAALARWCEEGSAPTFHYGRGREARIGYGLMEDTERHPAFPDVQVPTLVIHGRDDETVPAAVSIRFAEGRPHVELDLLDAEHTLGDVIDTVVARALAKLESWLGL